VRAILPCYGWKICFFIPSIQNFHHALGSTAGTDWPDRLLGKASIMPKCPGNAGFELQISNVPHGLKDLVYLYCLFLEVQYYPEVMQGCLPMMRSYNGAWSPGLYSMISI
jgi:hypothetical protein